MSKRATDIPGPWLPAPCTDTEQRALKALAAGKASEGQQQMAIRWIVNTACGTYDQPYRPGDGGNRDTDFACGKQFVGQQIVKQINMPIPQKAAN